MLREIVSEVINYSIMDASVALRILSCLLTFYFVSGGFPLVGEKLYIGCYKGFSSRHYIVLPLENCIKSCARQHYYFAAMKDVAGCHCGNKVSVRVSSSNCVNKKHYSVFTVVPIYLGCFQDSHERDLSESATNIKTLTIQKCLDICASKDVLYAGSQQYSHCYCGRTFGKYGSVVDSQCNLECPGNASQNCGAPWRNSIYAVKHVPGLMLNFENVFHCTYGTDIYGYCERNQCNPGWKGGKCHQRDCHVNNGNCGDHKCVEYIVREVPVSECECRDGFESASIYDDCEDVDECVNKTCSKETEICVNIYGSYVCSFHQERSVLSE